jgi:hypothetical protein
MSSHKLPPHVGSNWCAVAAMMTFAEQVFDFPN